MVISGKEDSIRQKRGRPKGAAPLDALAYSIYALLLRRIGYKRKPTSVPLLYIEKCVHTTRKKARNRIQKLVKEGLLETWTTKHPTQFKITYYRIPYLVNKSTIPIRDTKSLAS